MAEWKRFFAKAAKSFENQCETEGARSHQSLWKPFRFWFVSLNFGKEVLALQSVTSWCQNWSSGVPCRREAPAEKNESTFILFSKKWKIGHGRDLGSDFVSAEGASYRGPNPK